MDTLQVEDFLAHYASKYYDPVKAREYYLRTRELKGRDKGLSAESRQRQREATSYVSNEISTRRKAELDKNQKAREELSSKSEAQAKAHEARMEKLQKDVEATREKVAESLKSKMEDIADSIKIPENASPKVRAYLEKQRAKRLKSAVGKAKAELGKIREEYRTNVTAAREEYRKTREANSANRNRLTNERRGITDKYRTELASEKKYIEERVR